MKIHMSFVLGLLTAGLFVGALFIFLMFAVSEENKQLHTVDITVSGKVCNDIVFGEYISKIQADDGITYFIPNSDCSLYNTGSHGMIFYNHICNLPIKEPGPLSGMCFNRTVGDYNK